MNQQEEHKQAYKQVAAAKQEAVKKTWISQKAHISWDIKSDNLKTTKTSNNNIRVNQNGNKINKLCWVKSIQQQQPKISQKKA